MLLGSRHGVRYTARTIFTKRSGPPLALMHIVVIAVVQGITEFLPISSSGHLVLVPIVAGWPDQGLAIDVAVHVGTLGAVIVYLWRDVWSMIAVVGQIAKGKPAPGAKLLAYIVFATVPVVIAGLLFHKDVGAALRNVEVIGWTMLGFGLVLYLFDRTGLTVRRIEHMTIGAALCIGMAQMLALIPGTSRAGITITAARMLGFERRDAARFSMLLSIPTIIAAGALAGTELIEGGGAQLRGDAMLAGGFAFFTALGAIALMMGWLRRASYTPFVVYRVILGAGLLFWVYG